MNDRRNLVKTVFLAAIVVIVVVAVAGVLVYEQPSIVTVENRFGDVNESRTAIETDIVVRNPNPIGTSLESVTTNYTVRLNGVTMARGTDEGIPLERGNTTIGETVLLDNDEIPDWWVTHVRNGEQTRVDVTANATTSLLGREVTFSRDRTIETDITDRLNTTETRPVDPIDANVPLVSDPALYVNETSASWGRVTEDRTFLDLSVTLYNPSDIPYPISTLEYTMNANDVTVGNGTTDQAYIVPGGTERTVNGTVRIDNSALHEWWVTHIENGQTTSIQLDITAVIELPTGETVRLPLGPLTPTDPLETDFFGTRDATEGANGTG